MSWPRRHRRHRISLLVPFGSTTDRSRLRAWGWLQLYYRWNLPRGTEIIIGRDRRSEPRRWRHHEPYSKTTAIRDAYCKSHGDILVIIDADAYLDAAVIMHCAERLRAARRAGVRTWFMPYKMLYRLKRHITARLVATNPSDPMPIPHPPPEWWVDRPGGAAYGHRFGALCQIVPREAMECIGGPDPRFRGWGGEDSCLKRTFDTLWGPHHKTPNDIYHLWHHRFIPEEAKPGTVLRLWPGQTKARSNDWLANQYDRATGNPERMRQLVDEGHRHKFAITPAERSEAIFGAFDGVVTVIGFVFGLIIHGSPVSVIAIGATGGAVSATISMGVGEFEKDEQARHVRIRRAAAMGIATLIGSMVPTWPFFAFPRTAALVIAAAGCILVASWIGYEKHRGVKGFAMAYIALIGAAGLAIGITAAIPNSA